MQAGTDVDCGSFGTSNASVALAEGLITESDIDTVLRRLFRMRLRLGQFDPPGPLSTIGLDHVSKLMDECNETALAICPVFPTQVCTPEHCILNWLGMHGGCMDAIGRICVDLPRRAAPLTAISQFIPSAVAVLGVPTVKSINESGIPAAAAAAAASDLVVFAIGSDLTLEVENRDR